MKLPANVNAVTDRHGKTRYRFRKAGLPSRYLPHPDDPFFEPVYAACLRGEFPGSSVVKRVPVRRRKRKWRVRKSAFKGMDVVYFVGTVSGMVKIGTTVDLPGRLKKMQTDCPSPLDLLALAPGGADVESLYHTRFADLRVRGEWFKGKPIQDEIKRLRDSDWRPTDDPAAMSNLFHCVLKQ